MIFNVYGMLFYVLWPIMAHMIFPFLHNHLCRLQCRSQIEEEAYECMSNVPAVFGIFLRDIGLHVMQTKTTAVIRGLLKLLSDLASVKSL